jgi:2-polyprenyl-3-methyl-5-hydroxy-6-metoxy-1,4-benzoquinol methylase
MTKIRNKANIQEETVAKEFIKEYWEERSSGFTILRKAELNSNKYIRWKEEIKKKLPIAGLNILDVGCGCGFFSILLAELGHQVTGIDITQSMIEQGKLMLHGASEKINLLTMDAEKLTFDKESFDVVIARNVTWNLTNPKEAYKQWLSVLKSGGILLNYDAEYAKDHHKQQINCAKHAHNQLSMEELDKCHHIYHMLPISAQIRPEWDIQILEELGYKSIEIDKGVGERIYLEQDEFYIPTPMFGIKAVK